MLKAEIIVSAANRLWGMYGIFSANMYGGPLCELTDYR